MVIIEINNVLSRIIGTLQPEIVLSLKEACAYSIQGAEHSVYGQRIYCPVCKKQTKEATTEEIFSDAYPKDGQLYRKCYIHGWVNPISLWDGRNFLFNTRGLSFPTGIISRVITILQNANVQYTLKDVRLRPYVLPIQWHGPVLRYYQEEAVNEILKRTRGVIQAATGTGKTAIISAAIARLGVTTLVLTHTKSVFNQVHESLKNNLKMHIGVIGDGKFEPGRITVAMPQSLTETTTVLKKKIVKGVWKNVATKVQRVKPKVEEYLCGVEALFVDETHRLSANSCQLVANACTNAFYRVGVSATPWRDDMLDILIEAATGRVIYKYSATQAIQDKYLAKPVIHMVNFRQEKQPRKIWKDVLNKKTKQFEKKYVDFEYADLYNKCVTEKEERNKIIEKIVRERYALGESILVIVKHLQHGENLHKLLKDLDKDVRYVNGEDDPKFLQETLDDLDKKRIKVCIATGIFSEGVDVRYLNTVINTTAMDSSVNAMQVVGRALRKVPGKELVNIYDIADTNVRWLEQHAKNRRKIYQTEPGYDIIEE